ncbi:zinc finger protein Xfin [Folsomia candida]|uniref:Zinc finger protein Xfin n=1 Tax=Folsomia candida TaxID=158441 RepID=A0A226DA32_FOLCA|nr:zinc finger protein Xfin [Folsomia candida]OXA42079.1 Zinc finger protein Xfin [Folsomia candida]
MDIKEITGRVWVVLVSQDEKKLADEKLLKISSPPLLPPPPPPTTTSEYFCDDTIDIKVEVLPIVEHMEFIQSSHDDQPDPTDPLAIDFENSSTCTSSISQDYVNLTPSDPLSPPAPPPKPKPKPYPCPICLSVEVDRAFARPSLLRAHLNYHKRVGRAILTGVGVRTSSCKDGVFTCQICNGRTFTTAKEFTGHRNFHSFLRKKYGEDRPIRTKGEMFLSSAIPIQEKYTCFYANCQKEIDDRTKFLGHLKFHRRKEREGRPDSSNLQQRRSSIPRLEEYKCSKCDKVYPGKSRDAYRYHMRRHDELEKAEEKRKLRMERLRPDIPMQGSYFCEMCQRTFTDRLQYVNHLRAHARLARDGMDRPIAEKKERNDQDDDGEEEDEQDLYCQTCDKNFNDKGKFRGHMSYHRQLQAKGCDRPIATPTSSSTWKSEIPHNLPSYTCTTCPDRSFPTRDSFISHLMIHRSLKKKGCDRPVLSKEEWSKQNRKQSSCSVCSLEFESVRKLNEHEKQVHPNLEPSPPPRERIDTWKHLVPEQDTPYTCQICPERLFPDRDAFIVHLKHHKSLQKKGQDRVILSKEQWNEHRKQMKLFPNSNPTPRTSSQFHCSTCSKNFWKRVTFRNHMRYHAILLKKGQGDRVIQPRQRHWKEEVPYLDEYNCDKCPERRFADREGYIRHLTYHKVLERKGKGGKEIKKRFKREEIEKTGKKCDICERVFHTWKTYKGHMAYHTRIKKITGQDRKIEKKEELTERTKISLKTGKSKTLVEDLIGVLEQFGCSCGAKFYFKDALSHHLQQAEKNGNTDCKEIVVKKEVPEREEIQGQRSVKAEEVNNIEHIAKLIVSAPIAHEVKVNVREDGGELEEHCPENEIQENFSEHEMEEIPHETEMQEIAHENEVEEDPLDHEMEEDFENHEVSDDFEHLAEETTDDTVVGGNDIKIEISKVNQLYQQLPQENHEASDECVEDEDESMSFFYKCQTCEADSPSLTEYLRHQFLNHLVDQTTPLPCPFCAAQFLLGSALFLHCKEEHGEIYLVTEFTVACPACADIIHVTCNNNEGTQMELHFKQYHPTMVCRMCGKFVSNQTHLNKHIVAEHLKKKK